MISSKALGYALILVALLGLIAIVYGLFFTVYSYTLLRLAGLIVYTIVAGVIAWLGYALAHTVLPNDNVNFNDLIEKLRSEVEEMGDKV